MAPRQEPRNQWEIKHRSHAHNLNVNSQDLCAHVHKHFRSEVAEVSNIWVIIIACVTVCQSQ